MGSLRNVTTSGSDQKWEVMIVLKLSLVSGRRTFFGRGNEIHYIGGTEILPAPLDTAEEQKMIHMLGTVNEETARSMLIERNLRLVVYIAKKFDNTGIGVEDLISISKDRRNIYKEHCKSRSSFMGKEDRRRTRSSQSSGN